MILDTSRREDTLDRIRQVGLIYARARVQVWE